MDYEKNIEIPFGAKDSELKGWEYTIPEGFTAEIRDGKVIVREKKCKAMKAIESIIRVYGKTQGEWIDGYDMDTLVVHLRKAFAALEKQKDASYAIEAVDRIDKYIDEHVANAHDMKDSNPDKKYYRGWDDALGKMAGILQDVYSDERQEEQKPTMIQWTGKNLKQVIDFTGKSRKFGEWFKSWGDYENYVHSHGDIFKLFCDDGSHYEVPVGAWIVKTPDGYNIPSRFRFIQKPAEWGEKEKENLDKCCAIIAQPDTFFDPYFRQKCLDFLFEISKKFSLQPKQEWSEEEHRMLDTIEKVVHLAMAAKLGGYSEEQYKDMAFFLHTIRCLKPQPKQEWGEWEMQVLGSIIEDYEKANKSFCGYAGKIALLKAIRDGEYDLSKKEWSEEDEKMFERFMHKLEVCDLLSNKETRWARLRLKSLRPKKNISYGELPLVSVDYMEGLDTDFEKQVGTVVASAMNREHQFTSKYVKWTAQRLLECAKDKQNSEKEWSEEDKEWLSEVYFAIDHSMYSEDERQAMKNYIDSLRENRKTKFGSSPGTSSG